LAEQCADVIDETYACHRRGNKTSCDREGAQHADAGKGALCGALAAAVAVLYVAKDDERAADCQDELMDWFGNSFGGYDCESLARNIDVIREELCPRVILATYLQLRNYIDPDNHLSQKTLL
jgi:hypothetical protein